MFSTRLMLKMETIQTIEGRLERLRGGYTLAIKIARVFGIPVFVRCNAQSDSPTLSLQEQMFDMIGEDNLRLEIDHAVDYKVLLEGSVKINGMKAAFASFPYDQSIVLFAVQVTKFISIEKTKVW